MDENNNIQQSQQPICNADNGVASNNTQQPQYTNTQQQSQPQNGQHPLIGTLAALRVKWNTKIEQMNEQMNTLPNIDKLLNTIYAEKQNAVDAYFSTSSVLKQRMRLWTEEYARRYNALKTSSQIRYTEGAITMQVEAQLSSEKVVIDELNNFIKFMEATIDTLSSMIYGVNHKIQIYQIIHGMKH